MKRPYSQLSTSLLPIYNQDDPRKFKSLLEGSYKLRVIMTNDISKPAAKPVDDIDEPENEDEAREIRLNRTSARMMQLRLKDTNNTEINAIELEKIEMLNSLKPNWKISIEGPVEMRCGNIMLERKHVTNVEPPSPGENLEPMPEQQTAATVETRQQPPMQVVFDIDEDTEQNFITEQPSPQNQSQSQRSVDQIQIIEERPAVRMVEDWDEELEDSDDCIIIN